MNKILLFQFILVVIIGLVLLNVVCNYKIWTTPLYLNTQTNNSSLEQGLREQQPPILERGSRGLQPPYDYESWLSSLSSNIDNFLFYKTNTFDNSYSIINSSSNNIINCKLSNHITLGSPKYFNNLCLNPQGELVWFEFPNQLCPNDYNSIYEQHDNAGNYRKYPIKTFKTDDKKKNNNPHIEWHRFGLLNIFTLPSNAYHWNADTYWPLMIQYKNIYNYFTNPKNNNEFKLFDSNFTNQYIGELNIDKTEYSTSDFPLKLIPKKFQNQFEVKLTIGLEGASPLPLHYHILPHEYVTGLSLYNDIMFSLIDLTEPVVEWVKPEDDHFVFKYIESLDVLGFTPYRRTFSFSRKNPNANPAIQYKSELEKLGLNLTSPRYNWNIRNKNDYICYERGILGTMGYFNYEIMSSLKAYFLQSTLYMNKVIKYSNPLSQCPLYWYKNEQCQIQNKLKITLEMAQNIIQSNTNITLQLRDINSNRIYIFNYNTIYVTIINRIKTRRIVNIDELVQSIKTRYKTYFIEVNVIELESASFKSQLELFSCKTSILIFVHGAGGGNVQYLPRHSTVVEIGPIGFGRYFSGVVDNNGHMYYGEDIPNDPAKYCVNNKCGKSGNIILPITWFHDSLFTQAFKYTLTTQLYTSRCSS